MKIFSGNLTRETTETRHRLNVTAIKVLHRWFFLSHYYFNEVLGQSPTSIASNKDSGFIWDYFYNLCNKIFIYKHCYYVISILFEELKITILLKMFE